MKINYGKQSIDKEDIKKVIKTLKSDFLTCGPKIKEFEKRFANYVGVKYAVAVSSGTAGLHLACLATELKRDEKVITTPITFAASSNCALYCGAKPVFVDIKENGLIDEDKIEKKVSKKTKMIIPVHYSGLPCNLEKIKEIAEKNNLIVIEDACHALGARYKDSKIGDCKYSDMAVFSFHPVKHITTGEGGMVTTNSKELYEKLLKLRSHGIEKKEDWKQDMVDLGYNYRITDFQCALGLNQLKKINHFVKKRKEIARRYFKKLKKIRDLEIIEDENTNSYHLYVIKLKNSETRKKLYEFLKSKGIFCQVHYIPVYWHSYYKKLGYKKGLCPNAENFYERILSIPIYPDLTKKQQNYIIKKIKEFFKKNQSSKICLGTAQFGLDYGVNNKRGKIPKKEVFKILDFANRNGINIIETSKEYGESLEIIEDYLQNKKIKTNIITKSCSKEGNKIEKEIERLLKKIPNKKIYAYLVQDFEVFMENKKIIKTLIKLKKEGKIERIGFSVYYPKEIEYLLKNKIEFDLVQFPYNIFDQRFSYLLPKLKEKGVELHSRSVFLQGLLFKKSSELDKKFSKIKNKINLLRKISKKTKLDLSSLLINFVNSNKYIDKIIVGVDSIENLKENINSLKNKNKISKFYKELENLKEDNEEILIPINWTKINLPKWKYKEYNPLSKRKDK